MKVVLIGLRGSGKSTVGHLLAERLKWPFFDTDVLIQERAGMSVREVIEKNGEAHFRKIEAEVVRECARHDRAVIATGGGAILDPDNVSALRLNGFVVHLTASPHELWRRVEQDKASEYSRPQLLPDAGSGLAEMEKLMHARAAAYQQARHVEVTVENRTPAEVAGTVIGLMTLTLGFRL